MGDHYFWFFVILVSLSLLGVLIDPAKIYRYPWFMATVFGMFILPQAISLRHNPGAASDESVSRVFLMTCLCLMCCLPGCFARKKSPRPTRIADLDEQKLFHVGFAFVASGLIFASILSHTDIRTSESGGWTGPATIYGFFHQLAYPGFAICLTLVLAKPTPARLAATIIAGIVPLQSIVVGRREPALLFALTIGLTLYFQCGLRPSRWIVALLFIAGMLLIPATGTYRRLQSQGDWEGVRQLDIAGNFRDFLNKESILELRNAAMLIEATRRSEAYEYGAGYWNHLVFRFVPAQVLGNSLKESLMVTGATEQVAQALAGMDYSNPPGSTVTGMGDAFQQFGFAGCLVFAGIGLYFQYLWEAASHRGALFAQLLYIQSCTCGMRAITHWTLDFLPGVAYSVAFLTIAYVYGAERANWRPLRSTATAKTRAMPRSNRRGFKPACDPLFAQCLGDDKDKYGPSQPASEQEIKE